MNKGIIGFLKVSLGTALAVLVLYFVFENIDWTKFWERAKYVNYFWVIISVILSLFTYVTRAYRWNILLEPLGYDLKTFRTTLAVLIGYLANMVLPRLGEITRCGVLNRNDKIPMPALLGSVITERIIDVMTLLVLIMVSLIVESDRLFTFLNSDDET